MKIGSAYFNVCICHFNFIVCYYNVKICYNTVNISLQTFQCQDTLFLGPVIIMSIPLLSLRLYMA